MTERTSDYELAVRRQFSSFCKKVIHNDAYDYRKNHENDNTCVEVFMDDLHAKDYVGMQTFDTYDSDYNYFEVAGMNMKAQFKDERILSAIEKLSVRQKEVILLSVIEEESDTRIAEILHLDRSTVSEHRRKALAQLRNYLKENINQ